MMQMSKSETHRHTHTHIYKYRNQNEMNKDLLLPMIKSQIFPFSKTCPLPFQVLFYCSTVLSIFMENLTLLFWHIYKINLGKGRGKNPLHLACKKQ